MRNILVVHLSYEKTHRKKNIMKEKCNKKYKGSQRKPSIYVILTISMARILQ